MKLKVMVIGPTTPDSFADNVFQTLEWMGHQAVRAGAARPARTGSRLDEIKSTALEKVASADLRYQRHLVETARRERPDLVINLQGVVRPATVAGLRAHSGAVVLWFPDAVSSLGRHELFLAEYDRMFFKNRALVDQLAQIYGLPASYLPEAANSRWHRPFGDYGTREVLLVAGNMHPTRALLLDRLLADGVPLEIYGAGVPAWIDLPRVRRAHTAHFITREEKARLFRQSRAVLNNLHPAEFAGTNCRLYEATASGAVVLSERREGMSDAFDIGSEILTFDDYNQLLERCSALLSDRAVGSAIADAAAERSGRDHTYERRLSAMFDVLGMA